MLRSYEQGPAHLAAAAWEAAVQQLPAPPLLEAAVPADASALTLLGVKPSSFYFKSPFIISIANSLATIEEIQVGCTGSSLLGKLLLPLMSQKLVSRDAP